MLLTIGNVEFNIKMCWFTMFICTVCEAGSDSLEEHLLPEC